MRSVLSLIVCCLFALMSRAQTEPDTPDSIPVAENDTTHSFKKAMLYSALLPGAGQVYNHLAMPKGKKKAYWKVPLIYAGLGSATYFIIKNNRIRQDLRTEYNNRQKGEPPVDFPEYDDTGLLQLYQTHSTRRDLSILALSVVYLLNVVDAGVEAHFVHFDVSDDLTLSFHPVMLPNYTPGIGLRLHFR